MINSKSPSFCRLLLLLVTAVTLAMIEAHAQKRKPLNDLQDKPGATHSGKEPQAGSNSMARSSILANTARMIPTARARLKTRSGWNCGGKKWASRR